MSGDRSRERKSGDQTSGVKCGQGQPNDNHSDIGPPSQLRDGYGADHQASEQYSTDAQNDPKCREIKRSVEEHQGHEADDGKVGRQSGVGAGVVVESVNVEIAEAKRGGRPITIAKGKYASRNSP